MVLWQNCKTWGMIGSDYLGVWMNRQEMEPPTGQYLLDPESREKLPPLYIGEEQGLDALAHVKFFTPTSNWTWYASEFNGDDVFFGVMIGFAIEFGYVRRVAA